MLRAQVGTFTVATGPRGVRCSGSSNCPRMMAVAWTTWLGSSGAAAIGVAKDQAQSIIPTPSNARRNAVSGRTSAPVRAEGVNARGPFTELDCADASSSEEAWGRWRDSPRGPIARRGYQPRYGITCSWASVPPQSPRRQHGVTPDRRPRLDRPEIRMSVVAAARHPAGGDHGDGHAAAASGAEAGGSSARRIQDIGSDGRPQPVQWGITGSDGVTGWTGAVRQMAAVRAPMGMRRSSSIWMSSSAERPRVVR